MKQIAFLTDVHLGEQTPIDAGADPISNFERVLADVSHRKISEIVYGGDIGAVSSHPYFFDALKPFSLNLILGNHDNFEEVKKRYVKDEKRSILYYTLEDKNHNYIFLDSSTGEISKQQLEWLQKELDTRKKPILFVHHPILKVDTPVDKLYPLKNRREVRKVLEESQKEITVFCGHYHMNDEWEYKNIKQIITHSLSFQIVKEANELIKSSSAFGYRIIEISGKSIETELVTFNTL